MSPRESFSGVHEYTAACLELAGLDAEQVDVISARIDAGQCPRCLGPLPEPPEWPAGSRVTACRCVPVCGPCGTHEASTPGIGPDLWPVARQVVETHTAAMRNLMEMALLAADSGGNPVLITDTGSMPVRRREHPGGWAEFGHESEEGGIA